jgi:hypothetical protein
MADSSAQVGGSTVETDSHAEIIAALQQAHIFQEEKSLEPS